MLFSEKPGQPVVQVNPSDVKARSALVTWPYNPGADEMPVTAYNFEYRNSTSTLDIHLGLVLSTRIINLKPYTAYSVRVLACLLYTSPSPRDGLLSRMPSSA